MVVSHPGVGAYSRLINPACPIIGALFDIDLVFPRKLLVVYSIKRSVTQTNKFA